MILIYLILIFTFIVSWLAFILFGVDKRRRHYGKSPLATGLFVFLAIIAPFGSLMGMLLFGSRTNETALWIIAPLLMIIYAVIGYFIGGYLII